jgi:hypothetical protein
MITGATADTITYTGATPAVEGNATQDLYNDLGAWKSKTVVLANGTTTTLGEFVSSICSKAYADDLAQAFAGGTKPLDGVWYANQSGNLPVPAAEYVGRNVADVVSQMVSVCSSLTVHSAPPSFDAGNGIDQNAGNVVVMYDEVPATGSYHLQGSTGTVYSSDVALTAGSTAGSAVFPLTTYIPASDTVSIVDAANDQLTPVEVLAWTGSSFTSAGADIELDINESYIVPITMAIWNYTGATGNGQLTIVYNATTQQWGWTINAFQWNVATGSIDETKLTTTLQALINGAAAKSGLADIWSLEGAWSANFIPDYGPTYSSVTSPVWTKEVNLTGGTNTVPKTGDLVLYAKMRGGIQTPGSAIGIITYTSATDWNIKALMVNVNGLMYAKTSIFERGTGAGAMGTTVVLTEDDDLEFGRNYGMSLGPTLVYDESGYLGIVQRQNTKAANAWYLTGTMYIVSTPVMKSVDTLIPDTQTAARTYYNLQVVGSQQTPTSDTVDSVLALDISGIDASQCTAADIQGFGGGELLGVGADSPPLYFSRTGAGTAVISALATQHTLMAVYNTATDGSWSGTTSGVWADAFDFSFSAHTYSKSGSIDTITVNAHWDGAGKMTFDKPFGFVAADQQSSSTAQYSDWITDHVNITIATAFSKSGIITPDQYNAKQDKVMSVAGWVFDPNRIRNTVAWGNGASDWPYEADDGKFGVFSCGSNGIYSQTSNDNTKESDTGAYHNGFYCIRMKIEGDQINVKYRGTTKFVMPIGTYYIAGSSQMADNGGYGDASNPNGPYHEEYHIYNADGTPFMHLDWITGAWDDTNYGYYYEANSSAVKLTVDIV